MIGLLILAMIGFWNSYFSKILDLNIDYNFYFHFHVIMAGLWILVLITQPILIKKRKWRLHRQIGLVAHFLIGLFFISVILLTHSQQSIEETVNYIGVFIPFKDLLVLSVAYFIAMRYRKVVGIHSRGMIATGIAFIEPALVRAIGNIFPSIENRYLWTIAIIYTILILLIIIGRKYKNGQWVFPLILCLYLLIHSVLIFRLPLGIFKNFVDWFVQLPLT